MTWQQRRKHTIDKTDTQPEPGGWSKKMIDGIFKRFEFSWVVECATGESEQAKFLSKAFTTHGHLIYISVHTQKVLKHKCELHTVLTRTLQKINKKKRERYFQEPHVRPKYIPGIQMASLYLNVVYVYQYCVCKPTYDHNHINDCSVQFSRAHKLDAQDCFESNTHIACIEYIM